MRKTPKEICTMPVSLLKNSPWFYGLHDVGFQNNYAIEIMKWVVFEAF